MDPHGAFVAARKDDHLVRDALPVQLGRKSVGG
jgi:hypothetical protein